jgi:hypothetical protein
LNQNATDSGIPGLDSSQKQPALKGEKVDFESSGLSRREWEELVKTLD